MARILSYPNMNVQFQYLSQKITAPPVVGHGMIKLLKPLHLIRIGVRASSNEFGREVGAKKNYEPFKRSSSGPLIYPAEEYIKEHLGKPVPQDREKAAQLARELREDIDQGIPEDVRHVLLKKLEHEHISTMWEIAAYNGTDSAAVAAMLPEKWKGKNHRGKIVDIGASLHDFTVKFFRGDDSYLYGHLYYPGSWSIKKHSVYFIVRDANGNFLGEKPCTEKMQQQLRKADKRNANNVLPSDNGYIDARNPLPYDLAFQFVDAKYLELPPDFPKPDPEKFMDRRIYIRCAAPNVLVGRVLRHGGEHLGHIVLIKDGKAPE